MGAPDRPGTLLACRAWKPSEGSWRLSRAPEDGSEQSRERRGGTVPQGEAPACAKAGRVQRMEPRAQAGSRTRDRSGLDFNWTDVICLLVLWQPEIVLNFNLTQAGLEFFFSPDNKETLFTGYSCN